MEYSESDLINLLWEADIDTDGNRAHWGYSGRGMYGKKCFGFTGSLEDFANFILAITFTLEDDVHSSEEIAREFGKRACMDTMGHDFIFYFPGIQVLENQ